MTFFLIIIFWWHRLILKICRLKRLNIAKWRGITLSTPPSKDGPELKANLKPLALAPQPFRFVHFFLINTLRKSLCKLLSTINNNVLFYLSRWFLARRKTKTPMHCNLYTSSRKSWLTTVWVQHSRTFFFLGVSITICWAYAVAVFLIRSCWNIIEGTCSDDKIWKNTF